MSVEQDVSIHISSQENPDEPPKSRKWKGIIFALIVIAVISGIIIAASILTMESKEKPYYGEPMSWADFMKIRASSVGLTYQLVAGYLIFIDNNGSIIEHDTRTNTLRTLLDATHINEKVLFSGDFDMSNDMNSIILSYDKTHVHRHSTLAYYQALVLPKSPNDDIVKRIDIGPTIGTPEQPKLSSAVWSPTSSSIAFVHDQQLYIHLNVLADAGSEIVHISKSLPIANIRYGVSDYLYEEEILLTSKTFWWSPGGEKLAFVATDESNVSTYKIALFAQPEILGSPFKEYKYPVAGDPSLYNTPVVDLFIYDLKSRERQNFPRPSEIPWDANLISVRWIDEDRVVLCWQNRIWTKGWLAITQFTLLKSWVVFSTEITNGWFEMGKEIRVSPIVEKAENTMLLVLPNEYTDEIFYNIARVTLSPPTATTRRGPMWFHTTKFDVEDILYNFGANELLYQASGPDPKEMHLFWTADGSEATCLSCGNANCSFNGFALSEGGKFVVWKCFGPAPTTIWLYKVVRGINSTTGKKSADLQEGIVLQNNTHFKEALAKAQTPITEFTKVTLRKGTPDEVELEATMVYPPELNKAHVTQYPMMLLTYGGPTVQTVRRKFVFDWYHYLSATKKFIILSIDNRGTGNRGKRFENLIYKKLGVVEIQDQLDGVKEIVATHKFINKSQVCGFGWSYGGFTIAHLLGHPQNDIISCGVSVAPVTDFRLYDTAYTERYLGRITDNNDAYMRTRIEPFVENFKTKDFLLIHGTADDNVHVTNSARLIKALIDNGVFFQMMYYPDDNHGMEKPGFRNDLYKRVILFLLDSVNRVSTRHSVNFQL